MPRHMATLIGHHVVGAAHADHVDGGPCVSEANPDRPVFFREPPELASANFAEQPSQILLSGNGGKLV